MMSTMQNFTGQWLLSLKHYLSMTFLLSSPQRLPYNFYCMLLTVVLYYLVCILLISAQSSYAEISVHLTLELGLLALLVHIGLRMKNMPARFQQTFSALVGINLLITLVMILVMRLAPPGSPEAENPILYLLLIWNLAAISLVFKRAFEISVLVSAIITFNYFVAFRLILAWIYQ